MAQIIFTFQIIFMDFNVKNFNHNSVVIKKEKEKPFYSLVWILDSIKDILRKRRKQDKVSFY